MDKDKTTYLIRGLDKSLWNQFQGIARMEGKTARDVLIELIGNYIKKARKS